MHDVTTFSLDEINACRTEAQRRARPDETGPKGWSISNVDPMNVVDVFRPHLWVKDGWLLHAYQVRDCSEGGNGKGVVWAVPEGVRFLEPSDPLVSMVRRRHMAELFSLSRMIPKPQQAVEDFHGVIEGDGSPRSYALASILSRELVEFGAMWHALNWGDVKLTGETDVVVHDLGVSVTLRTSGGIPVDHYKPHQGYAFTTDTTKYCGSCVIH